MQLGKIPNWSPVVDLVTTDEFLTVNGLVGAKGKKIESRSHHPSKPYYSNPDRVFGTSGRGVTGAVTEFRYGLRADVGLEVDYPVPVKQSWIFATRTEEYDIEFQVLISLIDKSEAFYLSADLSQVGIHEEGATLYDLESRTLVAAQVSEDVIVQVTENCIVFSTPKTRYVDIYFGQIIIIPSTAFLTGVEILVRGIPIQRHSRTHKSQS